MKIIEQITAAEQATAAAMEATAVARRENTRKTHDAALRAHIVAEQANFAIGDLKQGVFHTSYVGHHNNEAWRLSS